MVADENHAKTKKQLEEKTKEHEELDKLSKKM
jgi:hypothetical protein